VSPYVDFLLALADGDLEAARSFNAVAAAVCAALAAAAIAEGAGTTRPEVDGGAGAGLLVVTEGLASGGLSIADTSDMR
jgi:hypothetical protein